MLNCLWWNERLPLSGAPANGVYPLAAEILPEVFAPVLTEPLVPEEDLVPLTLT